MNHLAVGHFFINAQIEFAFPFFGGLEHRFKRPLDVIDRHGLRRGRRPPRKNHPRQPADQADQALRGLDCGVFRYLEALHFGYCSFFFCDSRDLEALKQGHLGHLDDLHWATCG